MPARNTSRLLPLLLALFLGLAVWLPGAWAIVDGDVDPNTLDSPWAGVGSLSVGAGTYTGTLIAPNFVLTAAHVVSGRKPDEVTFNLNFGGDLTHRIAVVAIHLRPGFTHATGFRAGGEFDLAVLELAEPVPAGVPIYDLYEEELHPGIVLNFVGYGGGGMGAIGVTETPKPEIKRTGANVADCFAVTMGPENCGVAEFMGLGPKAIYLYDFDAPVAPGGRANGRLSMNEAALAGGDSGSPAFVYVQGYWRIAGVNTFAGRDGEKGKMSVFGTIGGGVLLHGDHAVWIRRIIARPESGGEPLTVSPAPHVPEPRTWFLLAFGALNVAVAMWRHARRNPARARVAAGPR